MGYDLYTFKLTIRLRFLYLNTMLKYYNAVNIKYTSLETPQFNSFEDEKVFASKLTTTLKL